MKSWQKNFLKFLVCLLVTFFTSCKTTERTKTVYYVPEINSPAFPELGEYEILPDGRVATDERFFRELLIFRTLYLEEIEKYNEKKMELEAK